MQADRNEDTPSAATAQVPTRGELRIAGSVLDELAQAHRSAWSDPGTRAALAVTSAWLLRVAAPGREARAEAERCECGATLAHVSGDGAAAMLCPDCDQDRLDELAEPDRLDWEGNASKAVSVAAQASAGGAIAGGDDPRIVIHAARAQEGGVR